MDEQKSGWTTDGAKEPLAPTNKPGPKNKTSGLLGDGSSNTWRWERAVGPIKNYIFLLMMDFFDWSTNLKKTHFDISLKMHG
jgi:hypothetical protein